MGKEGYYTLTAAARDKAGNVSEPVSRTALHDMTDPVTAISAGLYDDKKGTYPLTITLTDNLSVRDYQVEPLLANHYLHDQMNIGVVTETSAVPTSPWCLGQWVPWLVDDYNETLTTTDLKQPTLMVYRILQETDDADGSPDTDVNSLAQIRITIRDQAGNDARDAPEEDGITVPVGVGRLRRVPD